MKTPRFCAVFSVLHLSSTHFGPSDWSRTSGLVVPNHALYQLSYTRIFDFVLVWVRYGSGPFDPYCDPYYFNLIFNFFKR